MDAALGLNRRGDEGDTVLGWSFLDSACRLLFCSLMTVLPLGCCRWQRHLMGAWQQHGGRVGGCSSTQKETPCFPARCQGPWWWSAAGGSWCSFQETVVVITLLGRDCFEGRVVKWREDRCSDCSYTFDSLYFLWCIRLLSIVLCVIQHALMVCEDWSNIFLLYSHLNFSQHMCYCHVLMFSWICLSVCELPWKIRAAPHQLGCHNPWLGFQNIWCLSWCSLLWKSPVCVLIKIFWVFIDFLKNRKSWAFMYKG